MFCCFWHGMANRIYATVRIHFVNCFCKVTAPSFSERYSASDIFWIFIQCFPYFFWKMFILLINFEFWRAWSWCNWYVFKQKIIQFIRRNQVYFSSSNVSTDTTVIVKDYMLSEKFTFCFKISIKWNLTKSHATRLK